MGKPTGFMEYDRCEAASVEPKERIKNFNEFHVFLSKENQQKQAARCMDCGVPFCQSGMTIAGMSLHQEYARHCARRHVHVDTGAARCQSGTMSMV